jgi:hypothetical protein
MRGKADLQPSLDEQKTTNQLFLQPVANLILIFLLSIDFVGSNADHRS